MNPHLINLCLGGGLLSILVFIHLSIDFIGQNNNRSMNKHNNEKLRAFHCLTHLVGFTPIFIILNRWGSLSLGEIFLCYNILFWSHFVEDTYIPVMLWMRYFRKPPEMFNEEIEKEYKISSKAMDAYILHRKRVPQHLVDKTRDLEKQRDKIARDGLIKYIGTPIGRFLLFAVDQIIHVLFLFPIVWMALN